MNDALRPVMKTLLDVGGNALVQPDPAFYRMTPRDKMLMRDLRYLLGENQTQFWSRFGVAQSSGSRFERGMPVPLPVLLLIRLYFLRHVSDADLRAVRSPDYDAADGDNDDVSPAGTRAPCGWP